MEQYEHFLKLSRDEKPELVDDGEHCNSFDLIRELNTVGFTKITIGVSTEQEVIKLLVDHIKRGTPCFYQRNKDNKLFYGYVGAVPDYVKAQTVIEFNQ